MLGFYSIKNISQACSINPRSVEGLLLKGTLLLELKKLQEAVMHFREAMQIAPHRFEPHKVSTINLIVYRLLIFQ